LRDADYAGALVAIDHFLKDFPDGALREEAVALRIQALCTIGNTDDAKAAAAEFASRYPHSAHARTARCEGAP
jgi:TolA-binding protein